MSIQEKALDSQLITGIRVKDKYENMGKYIEQLMQNFGEFIAGPPFTLYYDKGYKEIADYEMCIPLSKKIEKEGFSTREIEGGKAISLIHKGSFDTIMKSWEDIFNYIQENKLDIIMPTREIYFTDPKKETNPEKYITEIQVLIK